MGSTFESKHPRAAAGTFAVKAQTSAEVTLAVPAAPELAGIPAPVRSPEGLTHVGSFDPSAKGTWSLEGQGLSVSQHPEEWQAIARLGSGNIWSVSGPDPRFLDYHELTPEQMEAITDWGVAAGYVTRAPSWTVTSYDDEWEEERYAVFLDREEAEGEAEESDGEIVESTSVVATDTFPDSTVKSGTGDIEAILATVWVSEVSDFDGVWWEDDLDVDRLSAPRGVIVPRAIATWIASAEPWAGPLED